jgi:ubiquinone biosynthesis protein
VAASRASSATPPRPGRTGAGEVTLRDLRRASALAWRAASFLARDAILRLRDRDAAAASLAPRLRALLETSGVTAVKIGQYLAIRVDLLPAEICRELSRLFDRVPALPFPVIRALVERELGAPLDRLFAGFDEEPIGAASIAQVHRARHRNGSRLAVKVQRPGVAAVLRSDFRVLRRLAWLADRLAVFGAVSAVELVDEIAAFTLRETDFRQEARTAERLRADAVGSVHIPRIERRLSTARVLTMEFIPGVPLAAIVATAEAGDPQAFDRAAPGVPPAAIADRLARACLRQLFVTGLFQGDPHPANVLVERDGTVAFVDFGIFGELAETDRVVLRRYVRNLALGRLEASFDDYLLLVEPTPGTDLAAYRRETLAIMAGWHRSAGDLDLSPALRLTAHFQGQMFGAMRRNKVRMRKDLVLFWRALAVLDSTAQRLPVRFDLLAAIRRFFEEEERGELVRQLAIPLQSPSRDLAREALRALRRGAPKLVVETHETPQGHRRGGGEATVLAAAACGEATVLLVLLALRAAA